jgi:S-layer protein
VDTPANTAGNDTYNGNSADGSAVTFTSFDAIDGGAGRDTLKIQVTGAINTTNALSATVNNVEIVQLTSAENAITTDTTKWTGVDTLTASSARAQTLTASATTDVTSTTSALVGDATTPDTVVVTGGKNVAIAAVGKTGDQLGTKATSTKAAANVAVTSTNLDAVEVTEAGGTVAVNSTFTLADLVNSSAATTDTGSGIVVTGGSAVAVNATLKVTGGSDHTNDALTGGAITVTGDAKTTSVSVTQTAAAARVADTSGNRNGSAAIANGKVEILDANRGEAAKAGTITTASVSSYAASSAINSGALTDVTLAGTGAGMTITPGNLTTAAVNTLNLNTNSLVNSANDVTVAGTAYKTLNIANTGTSTLNAFTANSAETINVSGSGSLTLTNNSLTGAKAINVTNSGSTVFGTTALVNGTSFTGGGGKETVIVGQTTKVVDLGAGDDTATVGAALGVGGTLSGGAGIDTLKMTADNAHTASANISVSNFSGKVTGFEVLELTAGPAATKEIKVDVLNANGWNTINKVVYGAAIANATTVSGLASGSTVVFKAANTAATTIGVKDANLSLSDVINIELHNESSARAFDSITAANVETVNIKTVDVGTGSSTAATVDSVTLVANAAKSIAVSGNNGLTITQDSGNSAVTSFDASGIVADKAEDTSANLAVTFASLNSTTTANVSITGGEGNDVLTGNAAKDTIVGGKGDDIITGGAGADNLSGGEGADRLYGDNHGTKQVATFTVKAAAATSTAADIAGKQITVNILGFNVVTTFAATDVNQRTQAVAIAAAINTNENLKGLVTASVTNGTNATDPTSITLTALVDGAIFGTDLGTSAGAPNGRANAVTIKAGTGFDTEMVIADGLDDSTTDQTLTTTAAVVEIVSGTVGTVGTAAADVINGGAGADLIVGGGGADVLTGGAGVDTFFFLKAHSNLASMATITDYTYAVSGTENDKLVLGDVVAAAGTVTTVQNLSAYGSLGTALDAAAAGNAVSNGLVMFIYGGDTYVYVESNSGNTYNNSDFVVKLTGVPFTDGTSISGLGFDGVTIV